MLRVCKVSRLSDLFSSSQFTIVDWGEADTGAVTILQVSPDDEWQITNRILGIWGDFTWGLEMFLVFVAAHKNAVEVVEETPAGLDMLLLFLVLLLSKSPWVPCLSSFFCLRVLMINMSERLRPGSAIDSGHLRPARRRGSWGSETSRPPPGSQWVGSPGRPALPQTES